ncbi:M23 family metallopeptidase [Glutamicibacter arilaitensis]|nr:M23 family metallopeptidase [Glutamicibacter arilaitensis]
MRRMKYDSTEHTAVGICWCDARFLGFTLKSALDQLWWHAEHGNCMDNNKRANMKKIYKKEGIELPEFSDIADQDRGKQHKATHRARIQLVSPTGGRGEVIQPFGANKRAYGALGLDGHNGLDYGVPSGTPVVAAYDGVVKFQGQGVDHVLMGASAGLCASVEHREGQARFLTGYAHLSRVYAQEGSKVKAGDVIGLSGASGMTTGDHLHFEVIPVGTTGAMELDNGYLGRIDPAPYLEKEGALFVKQGDVGRNKGGASK